MRTIMICILGLLAGYVAGAGIVAAAVELMSSNTHDRSVEMAMTAAFIGGPIGAAAGLTAAYRYARRRST